MNLKEIIKLFLIIVILVSFTWYSTYAFIYPYTTNFYIKQFVYTLPVIFGILLAGVLAGSAIVLGLLDDTELSNISQYEQQEGKEAFSDIIAGMKIDVYLILLPFIVFSFLMQIPIGNDTNRVLLATGNSFLILACYAAYDIINGLFAMIKAKYINIIKNKK